VLVALLTASAFGDPPHVRLIEGEGIVALTKATVIDGTASGPRRNIVVIIKNDRILYVGDGVNIRFGNGVRILDLTGRWIVPGFIDAHAHLPNRDGAASFLAQLLAFGTTTIRAAANPRVELRDLVARRVVLGPRLLVAGLLIDGKDSENGGAQAGTEDEVRAIVRRQAEQKVDFIKLYVGLPPNLVNAAIAEAHRHGLRVIGHLGATTWTEAADMGIDSLAHSWYAGLAHSVVPAQYKAEFRDFYIPNNRFDPKLFHKWREVVDPNGPEVARLASLLRERRIEVTPNLVLGEAVTWGDDPAVLERLEPAFAPAETALAWRRGRHPYSADWPVEAVAEAKRAFPQMARIIRVFHERGVLLTVGTDYMNPWMTPGVAFHRELELLLAAGIPPLDVLRMATRNGADALGILSETGTIEEGKRADLVVLTADPLAAIANTRKIEKVFLQGRSFRPAQLLGPH
jgi:imidazolonepropionase-like amidohydrolase